MSDDATGVDILGDGGAVQDNIVPNPSTPTEGTWMDGMSEAQVGGVQNKGWENAGAMYDSYAELEKWRGVPAEQIMKKPGEGESWDDIYSEMGRPEESGGYVYNAPEGVDVENNPMLDGIREVAFENGLSASAFTALTGKYDELLATQGAAMAEQAGIDQGIEIQELQREWGQDFERKVHISDQEAIKQGFSQDVMDSLRGALGVRGVVELMNRISDSTGEDSVNSTNNTSPYGATRESLVAEKDTLMNAIKADATRLAKFNTGAKDADRLAYNKLNQALHG